MSTDSQLASSPKPTNAGKVFGVLRRSSIGLSVLLALTGVVLYFLGLLADRAIQKAYEGCVDLRSRQTTIRNFVERTAELREKAFKKEGHLQQGFNHRFPEYLIDHTGSCGQTSSLLVSALKLNGISSRKLLIGINDGLCWHVVVEADCGGIFQVVDGLYGVAYVNPDGTPAAYYDLQASDALVHANMDGVTRDGLHDYIFDKYHFKERMYLNWFKFRLSKWWYLRNEYYLESVTPPVVMYRPKKLISLMAFLLSFCFAYCGGLIKMRTALIAIVLSIGFACLFVS